MRSKHRVLLVKFCVCTWRTLPLSADVVDDLQLSALPVVSSLTCPCCCPPALSAGGGRAEEEGGASLWRRCRKSNIAMFPLVHLPETNKCKRCIRMYIYICGCVSILFLQGLGWRYAARRIRTSWDSGDDGSKGSRWLVITETFWKNVAIDAGRATITHEHGTFSLKRSWAFGRSSRRQRLFAA